MTTGRLLEILARRWYISVIGLVITLIGLVVVYHTPSAHYGQLNVRFFAPVTVRNPNVIRTSSDSLVQTAGLVKDLVNGGSFPPGEQLSLTVRTGAASSAVSLPNSGNQFVSVFDTAVLSIEAIGPSPDTVQRRVARLADRIDKATAELQRRDGLTAQYRISTYRDPAKVQVRPLMGQNKRALLVVFVLGVAATCWSTVEIDRLLVRRRWKMRPARLRVGW